MINGEIIKSAIAIKIKSYATTTTIYKEDVLQGIIKPCYHIRELEVEQKQIGKDKYKRVYYMEIKYFPEEGMSTKYEELSQIGSTISEIISIIDVPTGNGNLANAKMPVKARQVRAKPTDGVLVLTANYTININQVESTSGPMMTDLTTNIRQED